MDIFGETKFDT